MSGPERDSQQRPRAIRPLGWWRFLAIPAVPAAFYLLSRIPVVRETSLHTFAWIEGLGPWGPLAFIGIYPALSITFFPDFVSNATAGMIWGLGVGIAVTSAGRLLGATACFYIVRLLARGWLERRITNDPMFAAIQQAIARHGFKIVVLLRVCPIFTVNLLSYVLGFTRISYRTFALATLIGMLPQTIAVAYLGSGCRSLAELVSGASARGPVGQAIFWGGLVVTIVLVAIIFRVAQRTVKEALGSVD